MNNKKFTLIELIVVIAILGILASLIVPNISSFKGDATVTAIASNVRNFQIAVDMYSLKNNSEYPVANQPTEFIPEPIDFSKLDKKYLKILPKTEGVKYWVDFQGRVWASTIDAPQKVTNINGTITWEPVTGAVKYQVFEVEGYKGTIGTLFKSKSNLVFKAETTTTSYTGEAGKYYTVNTIDKQNFQSAPTGKDYLGYATQQPISGGTESNPSPLLNKKPILAITMSQEQGLLTTSNITFNYTYTDEDGDTISKAEWQVDTNPIQTTAPDGTFVEETHIVKLRVQDSRGLWSDWVSKDFYAINSNTIKQIDAGANHTVALLNNGTVKTWGANVYGQLGDGTTVAKFNPVTISDLTNVKQISAGDNHTIALLNDGTVWTWGFNSNGEIGDGTTTQRNIPTKVTDLSDVKQISAGASYSVAVLQDGTAKAWGYNYYGQLGDGTTTRRNSPVNIIGLTNIYEIETGSNHTIALLNNGTLKAWGNNNVGQLGDGTTTQKLVPTSITGITNVKQISLGTFHTIALLNDETVKVWGDNSNNQLGDGTIIQKFATILIVDGLTNVKQVSAGPNHNIVLLKDGTVKTWGKNDYGQLGDGTTTRKSTPTTIAGLSNVTQISAGGSHTITLLSNNTMSNWGKNGAGQLGDGTTTQRNIPVNITVIQ